MLYPLAAATLADSAGLPMLPSCVIAAAGLFVTVGLVVRLMLGQVVRKANVKQKELEEEPSGDDTWWTQTTLILADDPDGKPPGAFTRVCGGAFAVLSGCWLVVAAGLVNSWVNPPFPRTGATAQQSRVGGLFDRYLQPRLTAAPHLALAQRIAQLARAAREVNRAGPTAVKAAAARPEIRAVFEAPAIAAALDDPELSRLIETGNLNAVLRHPRLVELLRRSDARAALLNAPIDPALDAAEEIVIGKREVAQAEPPKAEPPQAEPPKVEPPQVEPPQVEPPQVEPPQAEPPQVEPPQVEPPQVEPPKVERLPEPDLIPSIPTPTPKTYPHGHKKHTCDADCPRFVPPHGHELHACDSACPEFVAPHGHRLHRCNRTCLQYKAPHGHRLHDCDESCPKFVPPHGHPMHACDQACPEFKAAHGEPGHRCDLSCPDYNAPHGHRLHDCGESCPQFVPPHGHRLHACDRTCPSFVVPPPKVAPPPKVVPPPKAAPVKPKVAPVKPKVAPVKPKARTPLLPPTPALIHRVYAASNPYALEPANTLRPGQPFAFRAEIELMVATRRDVKKVVRWRVMDSSGKAVKAFERADRSPAAVGRRTSYVAGHVPPELAPGEYTLEVAVSLPGRAPAKKSTSLVVEAAPLLVRQVSLGATTEPSSRVSSASAGVTVYLRAIYAVQGRAASLRRRLTWQVTDSAGRSIPELEGSRSERQSGEFRFVTPLSLPADLTPGAYWFQFSVEVGGEIAEGQATLTVRQ